jgi:hypothetical protein
MRRKEPISFKELRVPSPSCPHFGKSRGARGTPPAYLFLSVRIIKI